MAKKEHKVIIREIEMLPLQEQIYQILIGNGIRRTFGNRLDLMELADELIFALDFVNGGEPEQPIALNTLPDLTGEDGVPALDLVKYFRLEDYVMESVLNG
jgi:hypothetical protein